MKSLGLVLLLSSPMAFAADGTIPGSEMSVGGVAIGQSPGQVSKKLGEPLRKVATGDFLDYFYPHVRVSLGEGVVAGLYTDDPRGCTPMQLCPGDRLAKMRSMYGPPVVADRETGRFYEYYATGTTCWLQISAKGSRVASIAVACQP